MDLSSFLWIKSGNTCRWWPKIRKEFELNEELPVLLSRVQFTSVGLPQFGGQYSDYVDKEEEVHLQGERCQPKSQTCFNAT